MPDSTPVSDVMSTDVVTLRPEQTVQEAADVLAGRSIGAAPVVDGDGKLVGLLRDEDLIVSEARLHVPDRHHVPRRRPRVAVRRCTSSSTSSRRPPVPPSPT